MMFYELLLTVHSLINTTNTQPIQDHAHTNTHTHISSGFLYTV